VACQARFILFTYLPLKKLHLRSDGGESGSKKFKRGNGDAYGGVWRSLRLAGIWSQAVGFVMVRLAGIWLQSP
jgi:hypothetical protein